ncbi:MAG: mevalonate kinase, partial [Lentisphaerae bacterium]
MLPVVKSITASAPGKLFIFGEYACLHDRPAMLCAVNRRIRVRIAPLDSDRVILSFQKLHWEGTLHHLEPQGDFFDLARFIIKTLNPPCGLRCSITSEISSELGLGSSAAFTVAMTTALMKLNDPRWPLDPEEVYRTAYNRIVLPFYKVGSGADIAAAVWGGVIYYQRSPFSVCHLPPPPDLLAF